MGERGAALPEALITIGVVSIAWACALGALADLPGAAARWDDDSAIRQRLRVIEMRVGELIRGAAPIDVSIDGEALRIPAIWPRRLGLVRAGAPTVVSGTAISVLTRADPHRLLRLVEPLAGSPAAVQTSPEPGCGASALCDVTSGDVLLAVAKGGECGLFRVVSTTGRLTLDALMEPGATSLPSGSLLVPIQVTTIEFDPDERGIRSYDGYRSDNLLVDGVGSLVWELETEGGVALGDGPFVGAGASAYDANQLVIRRVRVRLTLDSLPDGAPARLRPLQLDWTVWRWH